MTKKTASYIAKGVLLYITMISIVLFILTVDNVSFITFTFWFIANLALVIQCTHCINYDEFLTITGNKYLSKHYPEIFNNDEE